MSTSSHGILVGVTGAGDAAALRWAAEEAGRRQVAVTVVHAVGAMLPPPPPSVLLTYEPLMDVARELATEAADEFTRLNGGEPPRATLVEPGRPGHVLAELSAEADLVVVGHRGLGPVRRIVTSSTAVSVAAHAQCPAVVVPQGWYDDLPEQGRGWVTVGVHEHHAPRAVLDAAFEAATLRGCGVRLVHAWRADTVYDDIVMGRVDPLWRDRVEEEMRTEVAPFLAASEVAELEVRAVHDWPAEALTDLSRQSDLLVLGRRGHVGHVPHRMGSMARTVVRTAECPVMVVPV